MRAGSIVRIKARAVKARAVKARAVKVLAVTVLAAIGVLVAVAVVVYLVAGSSAGHSPVGLATPTAAGPVRPSPGTTASAPGSPSHASRPRRVAGYTAHALQRMRERGVSGVQVSTLVVSSTPGTWQADARTWKVTGDGLTVIISNDAKIVTVWRK